MRVRVAGIWKHPETGIYCGGSRSVRDPLPLAKQAQIAREQKLPTLSPNTVEENLCVVRSLLEAALGKRWVDKNVASNVEVEGAGYFGDERDYFTIEELRMILSSPLGTDPDACSDTMFS